MNVAASTLRRRPGRLARFRDRLRSRGWRIARLRAHSANYWHRGALFVCRRGREPVGVLALAYANRGTVFTGARVHYRLETAPGVFVMLPASAVRRATLPEIARWQSAALLARIAVARQAMNDPLRHCPTLFLASAVR